MNVRCQVYSPQMLVHDTIGTSGGAGLLPHTCAGHNVRHLPPRTELHLLVETVQVGGLFGINKKQIDKECPRL
jgi:hypothetical protein